MKKFCKYISIIFLCFLMFFLFAGCNPSSFSTEEHIERISKKVNSRYMTSDYDFTGFKVVPLYNGNDEVVFYLIEFEPYGFIYVKLFKPSLLGGGMYKIHTRFDAWNRKKLFDDKSIPQKNEIPANFQPLIIKLTPNRDGTYIDLSNNIWKLDGEGNYYRLMNNGNYRYLDKNNLCWEVNNAKDRWKVDKNNKLWEVDKNDNFLIYDRNNILWNIDENGELFSTDDYGKEWFVDLEGNCYVTDSNGKKYKNALDSTSPSGFCEIDIDGKYIYQRKSPYYVADTNNAKRYMLEIKGTENPTYITAIKKGDKFLNLISMEEFRYQNGIADKKQVSENIFFLAYKSGKAFDL